MHQGPPVGRAHQHLAASRMAVPMGILAGLVHVEFMVRVLHERHAQPRPHEHRDQLLDERGLAAAAVAGDADDLHALEFYGNTTTWRTALPSSNRSKASLMSSSFRRPESSLSTGSLPSR